MPFLRIILEFLNEYNFYVLTLALMFFWGVR